MCSQGTQGWHRRESREAALSAHLARAPYRAHLALVTVNPRDNDDDKGGGTLGPLLCPAVLLSPLSYARWVLQVQTVTQRSK